MKMTIFSFSVFESKEFCIVANDRPGIELKVDCKADLDQFRMSNDRSEIQHESLLRLRHSE